MQNTSRLVKKQTNKQKNIATLTFLCLNYLLVKSTQISTWKKAGIQERKKGMT